MNEFKLIKHTIWTKTFNNGNAQIIKYYDYPKTLLGYNVLGFIQHNMEGKVFDLIFNQISQPIRNKLYE